MKRNKFMEFLNSKGQYAAIFAFVVVAGICAGTAAYNKNKPQVKTDEISEQPSASSEPDFKQTKTPKQRLNRTVQNPGNADTNVIRKIIQQYRKRKKQLPIPRTRTLI